MKFAHLADCHIGSWRDPKLKDVAVKAFSKAVDLCIEKNVDFVLISGDLFNTSLPAIDNLKQTVEKLKQLKDEKIPVYAIAGSHDFSPSGKTMLDVLEKAGLMENVTKIDITEDEKIKLKFTIDKKTGAKITGLLGKKGSLEKTYYESLLKRELEQEDGYKIFLFHSALTELKPESLKEMDSHSLSLLPKNFNYYAGGHPHFILDKQEQDYGLIAYPGPLFPNNFKELEELERGGFYIVNVDENEQTTVEYQPIQIHNLYSIKIDANNKTPEQIQAEIKQATKDQEFNNTIITLRVEGVLELGKISDIDFKGIFNMLYDKSAYFVMKNTAKLTTKEFEEISVEPNSVEEVENKVIKEHVGQIKLAGMDLEREEQLTKQLMQILSTEKQEGETNAVFNSRVIDDVSKILEL